jgi:hypothetical protein
LTTSIFLVQADCTGPASWVPSYQVVGGSSSSSSTTGAQERRVPSAGDIFDTQLGGPTEECTAGVEGGDHPCRHDSLKSVTSHGSRAVPY